MNDNPSDAPNNDLRSSITPPTPEFDIEPATKPEPANEVVEPDNPPAADEPAAPAPAPFQPVMPDQPAQSAQPVEDSPKPLNDFDQPAETSQPVAPPAKKSKKPMIIAVLVALFLLLGGGAVYAFWYQNPERVVGDAMSNLLSASDIRAETSITSDSELMPGIVNIKIKNVKLVGAGSKESVSGEGEVNLTVELNGRDYSAGAKAMFTEDQTIYFQINDIKDLFSKVASDLGGQQLPTDVQQKLEKLQNRWVKVPLSEISEETEATTCFIDTTKRLAKDPKYAAELKQLYHDHKFLKVGDSVGSKDGNLGYKVELDQKALREYAKATNSTAAAEEYKKCPGFDDSELDDAEDQLDELSESSDDTKVDVIVWVSRFGHELKQVDYVITGKNASSKDIVFKGETKFFYDAVKLAAPSESVDYEVWTKDFEDLMGTSLPTQPAQPSNQLLTPVNQVET